MIFIFRKGIRRWNFVWWLVLGSLLVGSIAGYFMRQPVKGGMRIASVNGKTVSLSEYQHIIAEIRTSLEDRASYWGVSADLLAKAMGIESVEKLALDRSVQNELLDGVANDLNVRIDIQSFQEKLGASVGGAFIDASGKVNMDMYQNHLHRLQMTVGQFEASKANEFRREAVANFLQQSAYTPESAVSEMAAYSYDQKSFSILTLAFSDFLAKAKSEQVAQEELKKFYQANKEVYRVEEKRKVRYWTLLPDDYKNKVIIDDQVVEQFYEKNKSSLYRISPKVKVRTIVFKVAETASPELVVEAKNNAALVLKKVKENVESFAALAQKYSQDKVTGVKGGLVDFFQRGTYDPEFEKTAFVVLKNAGDVSEVVKTKRGFEIIKLEDRIAASEKPLEMVREEIIKTLKGRKALMALRGDLEALVHTGKTDTTVFEKFAASNDLKVVDVGWLTKSDTSGNELKNLIAQKLFADGKRGAVSGYFVYQGKYILYNMTEKSESYVPAFEQVAKNVAADWYAQKAEKLQNEMARKIRREIIDNKTSLEVLAATYGFKVVTTPMVKQDGKVAEFKNAGALIQEAFSLTNSAQVLEYQYDTNHYLVQLVQCQKAKTALSFGERGQLLALAERGEKQRNLDGFIASLQRNARIEISESMLQPVSLDQ